MVSITCLSLYSWRKENNLNEHIFFKRGGSTTNQTKSINVASPRRRRVSFCPTIEASKYQCGYRAVHHGDAWDDIHPWKLAKTCQKIDSFCKRNLVFGACVQLPWCVDILETPKKSQRTSVFDDIIHFVDVRVGILSSHFVLRKFVFFLEIPSHCLKCRNIWKTL